MDEIEIVEMELREIQATEGPGAQIVILSEAHGTRQFPIFIGFYEMDALDRAIHGKAAPRPLTHELILNVIEGMGGEFRRVIIDDLRDDTFFGKLDVLRPDGQRALIDSRPSDALVLAMRRRVPIFVAEHVLQSVEQRQSNEE